MTEQHEWELVVRADGAVGYRCSNGNFMGSRTLTRVLNEYETLKRATEVLTAEDALEYADAIKDGTILNKFFDAVDLRTYADILEGKDG